MKILVAAPYFYDSSRKEFSKTSSGFGYMVKDILDAISDCEDVYVFTHQFTDGYEDKFHVLKHNKRRIISSIRIKDFLTGCSDALKGKVNLNTKLHYFYYQIDKGSFFKAVNTIKPDVVHIHGLTYQTKPFIEVCDELGVKYVVTLHGLNGINETVMLPDIEKEYEKTELLNLGNKNITVTVISTGILNKIRSVYGLDGSNIKVIINGTNFKSHNISKKNTNIYEIVCIGSISFRKNQTQLIDSLKDISVEFKKRIHITFCGVDSDGIDLNSYIHRNGLQGIAEYKGFVPREEMAAIWEKADLNVVMSKDEGFGLSMIEGFMYGVPTATFSDLDAIADLFNEDAIVLFKSRQCEDVQRGIIDCIQRRFDRNKIIEWGEKFSMTSIGEQYSALYKEIIRNNISYECK